MAKLRALDGPYPFVWWYATDHEDYSRGLRSVWRDPRILINIEHDVAAEPWMVDELIACEHPLCAWLYWIAPATTGQHQPILSARESRLNPGFAKDAAPGFCKIAPYKRRGELPPVCNYHDVEGNLWRLCGGLWHLHTPPVPHYHGFTEEYYASLRQLISA